MKTWNEIKQDAKERWWRFEGACRYRFYACKDWAENNKELALALIPVGIVAIKETGKLISSIDRKIDLRKEQDLKELEVYDHSLGMYHKLKRPMTSSEKIELSIRVKNGEPKVAVLRDMGLLG